MVSETSHLITFTFLDVFARLWKSKNVIFSTFLLGCIRVLWRCSLVCRNRRSVDSCRRRDTSIPISYSSRDTSRLREPHGSQATHPTIVLIPASSRSTAAKPGQGRSQRARRSMHRATAAHPVLPRLPSPLATGINFRRTSISNWAQATWPPPSVLQVLNTQLTQTQLVGILTL